MMPTRWPSKSGSAPQKLWRRCTCVLLAGFVASCQLMASVAQAQQSPDLQAPVIELEALADSPADKTQVFTALVTDDRKLSDVTLYHRRSGQLPFTAASMQPLGTTGYFTVSIQTDPTDLRLIEYYLQARDDGGNRTVSGFAFDPYQRIITAAPVATAEINDGAQNTTQAEPTERKRQWWKLALGVLAVGTLAALASSGGSDGGSSGTQTPLGDQPGRVPLTVTISEP